MIDMDDYVDIKSKMLLDKLQEALANQTVHIQSDTSLNDFEKWAKEQILLQSQAIMLLMNEIDHLYEDLEKLEKQSKESQGKDDDM